MRAASRASVLAVLLAAVAPARAADVSSLERMATCRDSWLDWSKTDPARMKKFADDFRAGFSPGGNDAFFVPKTPTTVAGFRVVQAFPDSVGMGVGFSVVVDATFDEARRRLEKALGKPFVQCETGDNMRTCGREIADKRTLTLMADDNAKSTTTLVGCYYYYEK